MELARSPLAWLHPTSVCAYEDFREVYRLVQKYEFEDEGIAEKLRCVADDIVRHWARELGEPVALLVKRRVLAELDSE